MLPGEGVWGGVAEGDTSHSGSVEGSQLDAVCACICMRPPAKQGQKEISTPPMKAPVSTIFPLTRWLSEHFLRKPNWRLRSVLYSTRTSPLLHTSRQNKPLLGRFGRWSALLLLQMLTSTSPVLITPYQLLIAARPLSANASQRAWLCEHTQSASTCGSAYIPPEHLLSNTIKDTL